MTVTTCDALTRPPRINGRLRALAAELFARERRLAWYGLVLIALVLPMLVAAAFDDRVLRDANVWVKPIKFALSIALLAWTTAWFVGHLPAARRRSRAVDVIVWLLIATGSFEFVYILVQAALGEASHYNVGDAFHGTMYTLMGIGAMLLTATQPMLAWQLHRHPDPRHAPAMRLAVKLGLVLTFVMGAGVGIALGATQPPHGGTALPVLGWQLGGGDLRPAHFVGIHAEQFLPAVAFVALRAGTRRPRAWVWLATLLIGAVFTAAVAWGFAGRV